MPINPVSIVALVIAAYWGLALLRTRNRPAEWRSPTIPAFSRDTYMLIAAVGVVAAFAVAVWAAVILGPI
jgi:hypothetical protein